MEDGYLKNGHTHSLECGCKNNFKSILYLRCSTSFSHWLCHIAAIIIVVRVLCCAVRCCSLKWSSGSYLHVSFQFQFSIATTREMGKNSHATNNKCSPMNIACNAWRWSAPSVCPYYCIITAITKRTTQMRTELMDTLAYYRSCIIHLYKQFPPSSTYIHRRFWRQASWIVSSFHLLKPFRRLAASHIRRTDTQWHVYESRRLRVHQ